MADKSFSDKLEAFGTLGVAPMATANVSKPPPISSQERELAQAAIQEYNKGNHAACIASLVKLEALRPKDLKLGLNKAVAQFCQSGQKDTEAFTNTLAELTSQVKEEEGDIQSFLHYNHALVLFRHGQLSSSLKHLLKAFQFIESMDEGLSQRVSLLMLEVLLCLGQPHKTLALLSYVENQLLGSLASQTSPNSSPGGAVLTDKTTLIPPGTSIRHKKEPATKAPAEPPSTPLPPAFEPEWLRAKLASLRARAVLQARLCKSGKKDVKSLISISKPAFNITTLMLKSHLDYLKGNYNKAARVLSAITPMEGLEAGDSPSLLWFNNSACAHFSSGRNRLAIRFLTRAMEEANAPSASNPECGMRVVSAQLSMNMGLVLLHSGQPEAAFPHLLRAARNFPSNPRLWLRLAECCINVKHPSNTAAYDIDGHGKDILKGTIACASGRKLILASSLSKNHSAEKGGAACPTLSLEFASLCLRNALLLLSPPPSLDIPAKQTPNLGDRSDNNSPPAISQPVTGVATLLETLHANPSSPQCLPSCPLTDTEVEGLRVSILTASAYVSLCLGEPILAVEHAKALLALPTIPGAFRLLGQLYAAEGLLQLDQISEAIDLLHPDTLPAELSINMPESPDSEREPAAETRPQEPWEPVSVQTAKATMLYNLAVAYAIRGNLDKASEAISLVWSCKTESSKVPVHLIMLSIYVELQQGHIQNARNLLIKHGIPHQP